jgi:tetratricopeptide (TPR) repeat protein
MDEPLRQIEDLLSRQDIKKAEIAIAKLLRADPVPETRARLLLLRARARLIGQLPDDALEDIQTARALEPAIGEDLASIELLADTYFARFELAPVGFADRSDADQALKLYQLLARDFPSYTNLGWVQYQTARILLTEGRVEDAINCLQTALMAPSQMIALTALCYERLGFIYLFERRDPATALSFLNKAAATYPPTEPGDWLGQLHILRSRALRDQNKPDEALQAAQQALQMMEALGSDKRSGQQDAHLALGEILACLPGRAGEAVEHLQQFMQIGKKPLGVDVTWSRVNELLGDLLFGLGRFNAAIEAYNNALAFNPYHPWEASLYYQIARCHYHLRAYEKTVASIEQLQRSAQAEAQSISDYRVFHLLGNGYFALEQYGPAVGAYQQAIELAPPEAEDRDKIETYLRFARELSSAT